MTSCLVLSLTGRGSSDDDRSVGTETELTCGDVVLLGLLADGLSPEEVAGRVGLSGRTVRRRIRAVCDRLGVATPDRKSVV